ncbi:MAG: hypothetical protein LBT81_02470 [Helicobacteraceae bacterium]|nr:hypothetical protein [Helicobacteraceae bacterium]
MSRNAAWIRALKIAVVNGDVDAIAALYGDMPTIFESRDEAAETAALISAAVSFLRHKREELQTEIEQIKRAISYQKNQLGSQVKERFTIAQG